MNNDKKPVIIFEDDQILVIDKPYGMITNKADTTKAVLTVQEWAEGKLQILNGKLQIETDSEFIKRGGIVHRLDKDTSGVLIIAKTEQAFYNLQLQFKNRTVKKIYLALVHGMVKPPSDIINDPIERNPFTKKRFGVFLGGREAVTEYKTITNSSMKNQLTMNNKGLLANSYSLLAVLPHTGRTHQIRVHLKHRGYPIVSDVLYGFRKIVKQDMAFCPRMFLHARAIEFKHPLNNNIISLEAKLPDELEKVLEKLKS